MGYVHAVFRKPLYLKIYYSYVLFVGADFSFASYYNDHMVLQKSPMKANIWGYLHNSAVNNEVSVELNNKK